MSKRSAEKDRISSRSSRDILKYLREKKKMTLEKIAEIAGVSRSFLDRVTKGKTTFTIDHFMRLEGGIGENLLLAVLKPLRKNASPLKKKLYADIKKGLNLSYQLRQKHLFSKKKTA